MTIDDIREIAKTMGIQSVQKFEKKEDLIWTIQLAEGFTDCYIRIPDCTNEKCTWFDNCIRKIED